MGALSPKGEIPNGRVEVMPEGGGENERNFEFAEGEGSMQRDIKVKGHGRLCGISKGLKVWAGPNRGWRRREGWKGLRMGKRKGTLVARYRSDGKSDPTL